MKSPLMTQQKIEPDSPLTTTRDETQTVSCYIVAEKSVGSYYCGYRG